MPNTVVWEANAAILYGMVMAKDGTLYGTTSNGSLISISPSGSVNWCIRYEGQIVYSPFLDDDGSIFFICFYYVDGVNTIDQFKVWVYKVDSNGEVITRSLVASGTNQFSEPTITPSGNVIVSTFANVDGSTMVRRQFICYDNGLNKVWTYAEEFVQNSYRSDPDVKPTVSPDGSITVIINDTYVHLSSEGELLWKYSPGHSADSPYYYWETNQRQYPVIANETGCIYLGMDDYGICLYPNGTEAWRCHFVCGYVHPIALSADFVYFTDSENIVFATRSGEYRGSMEDVDFNSYQTYDSDFSVTSNGALVFFNSSSICYEFSDVGWREFDLVSPNPDANAEWGVMGCLVTGNDTICYFTISGDYGKVVTMTYQPIKETPIPTTSTTTGSSIVDAVQLFLIVVTIGFVIFGLSYIIPKKPRK